MSNKATARVPASTTNLGPGFDVLGLALQLYSTISLEEIDDGTEIEVTGIDVDKLSNDESNIAYRAAKLVFDKCGYKPKGLRLVLTNGIPAIRGLGGSGTATLGGLLTANALCDEPFSRSELLDFATEFEGHPDNVAASLLGGLVISMMQGDHVHSIQLDCGSDLRVVVAIPNFSLSTKAARRVLPQTVNFADAIHNVSPLFNASRSNSNRQIRNVIVCHGRSTPSTVSHFSHPPGLMMWLNLRCARER